MQKIILIVFLFCTLAGHAQNPLIIYVDSIIACPPNEVWVPVRVLNFNNINSLSIGLKYNSNTLSFNGSTGLNAALSTGFMAENNTVVASDTNEYHLAWYSVTPASVVDSQSVITIKFQYNTGSSFLIWDMAGTAIVGSSNIPVVFINGTVEPWNVSIIQQPADMNLMAGNPAMFCTVTQAPSYVQRQWQISADGGNSWNNLSNTPPYTGVTTDILTLDTVTSSLNNDLYRWCIMGCDTLYSQPALLTVLSGVSFSGTLSYLNTSASPLINSTINLVQGGTTLYSVNPDNFGYFEIPNIQPGTYDINIQCFIPWGGNTAADALAVLKHFTGMAPLSGLPLQAADIDLSGFVNSMDALLILKRFVGLINHYPAGNWLFDATSITIPAGGASLDIHGICVGDVNQSYTP
ncbi:MAG: dockerin type I repeat-containing protein [Bacteroidetes bacterium]|nr:dockerin type I repeat-containing protein [Bacteroidota bacterium]